MDFGKFDPELVEATFNHLNMPSLPIDVDFVEVYAIGGGIVGNVYHNQWWGYRVVYLDGSDLHGTDLHIGLDSSHSRAAMRAAEALFKDDLEEWKD